MSTPLALDFFSLLDRFKGVDPGQEDKVDLNLQG